jgi:putative SOS response-associated peptidase YedK
MCGRYTLTATLDILLARYHLDEVTVPHTPRYQIAPGQMIPVILTGKNGERRFGHVKWGLIPVWAKDEKIAYKMINARSETVLQKPAFQIPFMRKRCIIPADGFYEWKQEGSRKQPVRVVLQSRELFSMAGLYDTWLSPTGQKIHTCTILTTQANPLLREIHDRMPVILKKEQESIWLDRGVEDTNELLPLLKPYPAEEMEVYPVSPLVNNAKHDTPDCIKRWEEG